VKGQPARWAAVAAVVLLAAVAGAVIWTELLLGRTAVIVCGRGYQVPPGHVLVITFPRAGSCSGVTVREGA
jgi:hypothetical protein